MEDEEEDAGEEDDGCRDFEGESEGVGVVQPADEGGYRREDEADDEVPQGEDGCPHVGEGLFVDVAFQDGGGEAAHDVEEEEDAQRRVAEVERHGDVASGDEQEYPQVGAVYAQPRAERVGVEGGDADNEVQDGPHDSEEPGRQVDCHQDGLDEPCHGERRRADDAGEEDVVAQGAVFDQRVAQDGGNPLQGMGNPPAGVEFPQCQGCRYADERHACLAVEGQAQGYRGEEPAEYAGDGFGEVAYHGDFPFVFQVFVFPPVVEHAVVEQGGVGSRYEALPYAQEDFRQEECPEYFGAGVGDEAAEHNDASRREAAFPSPCVRQVAGRDVERDGNYGVHALQQEDFLHAQPVVLIEEHDDGHHEGEPFGYLNQVKGVDIFL